MDFIDNNLGTVKINKEVIAQVAGITAIECYGIVGMAMVSVKSGIARLLKRDSITKGIEVNIEGDWISIDFHIIVEYGVNITAVTDTLISTVQYKMETFTGMKVNKINVFVESIRVDE